MRAEIAHMTRTAWPAGSLVEPSASSGILLSENKALTAGPPSLLRGLTARERARVLASGHRKVVPAGTAIFSQGAAHTGIFLVERGCVRVFYSSPSGREITLAYWNPGNFVGGPDVFGGGRHTWSGVAVKDTTVFSLPGRELRQLCLEIPTLAVGLIECLAFKGQCYSALAQILGTRCVTERLAHLLLRLADIYGRPVDGGILIDAEFTHADLAHIVGATRQWVTMTLKRLQAQRALVNTRGRIVVSGMQALMAFESKER